MTKDEAKQLVGLYMSAWPRHLPDEAVEFWVRQFQRLDFDAADAGLAQLIDTRDRAPSLGAVRDACSKLRVRRETELRRGAPMGLTSEDRKRGLNALRVIRQMQELSREGKPFEHLAPQGEVEIPANCLICEDRKWVENEETQEWRPCRRCNRVALERWVRESGEPVRGVADVQAGTR